MPIDGNYHPSNIETIELAYPKDMFTSSVAAAHKALVIEGVESEFQMSVTEEDEMWHIHLEYVMND
jgi:hypothetical protein